MIALIVNVLIVVGAAVVGWLFWRQRQHAPRGRGLLLVVVVLEIMLLLGSFLLPAPTPPPILSVANWERAMAEVMGRRVRQLVPKGGRVLAFVTPLAATQRLATLREQRELHLEGLKRGLGEGYTITVVETAVSAQGFNLGVFSATTLEESLQTYPDTKAVVNFLWSPGGLKNLSATSLPPVLVAGMSSPQAQEELAQGHIVAAVINRTNVTLDLNHPPQGEAQKIFDTRYQLLLREADGATSTP